MSTAIALHLPAAAAALVLGAALLVMPKGTPRHRRLGRCWVGLMAIVALSSLWIPSFMQIGWIHGFTLVVAINVPYAIVSIRRGVLPAHRWAMIGSFIGLCGAALGAMLPGRIVGDALAAWLGWR
ncbi:MAG: DUF2306 domain-containing protein [Rhodospirillales bacterium]|jgi:uncharacterized membrane protein